MSTRRLAAAAVLLTVSGLALLLWPSSPTTSTSPPASTSTRSAAGTSPGEEEHEHDDSVAAAEQRQVVEAFAAAFTAAGQHDEWLASLVPHVSPGLLDGFAYTDPRRRPSGRVEQITHLHPGDLFRITYRGGESVVCTLDRAVAGTWVINSVTPARVPAPTGHDL